MATIFFSYSHQDEKLRDKLEAHLATLKREGLVEAWHDRKLVAGSYVESSIDKHIDTADIVLILVSADFLNSKYCYDVEMKRALERHNAGEARVIPIILRPCDWRNSLFGALLAAPTDGLAVTTWSNRDEAFLDIVKQIRGALAAAKQHPAKPVLPVATSSLTNSTLPEPLPRRRKASSTATRVPVVLGMVPETEEAKEKAEILSKAIEYIKSEFELGIVELRAKLTKLDIQLLPAEKHPFGVAAFGVIVSDGSNVLASCTIEGRVILGGFIAYQSTERERSGETTLWFPRHHVGELICLVTTETSEVVRMREAAEYFWSLLLKDLESAS